MQSLVLLARAIVLGLSPRAVLAVTALALSIAYALVSAGALSTLEGEAGTLDEAREHPGHVLWDQITTTGGVQANTFEAHMAPTGALLVDWAPDSDLRIATLRPPTNTGDYPGMPTIDRPVIGPYAPPEATQRAEQIAATHNLPGPTRATLEYLPRDALVVPPDIYDQIFPHRNEQARLAYIAGEHAPTTPLNTAPWQGIGVFYETGAQQLNSGLIAVIVATGVIAALLASGLVYLEVLARRRDLATIESLAGARLVRRLVIQRTLVLIVTGILLGILIALALLRLASVAMGTTLQVPAVAWIATVLAVGTGAMLAGSLAGLRALERHGLKTSGTSSIPLRRFPGPIRFYTLTPRVFPGVFAATLVTTMILLTIMGATAVPATLFQAPDDPHEHYVGAGSGNMLRGSVDRMLGTHGHFIPGIKSTSAETFAPTVAKDRPLMVRGVDHARWSEHENARLVEGEWPTEPGEATLGIRAHRVTGLGPGDTLLVPASYHRGAEAIMITGIHRSGDTEDDQLLPDLDTAGRLAGLPPDRVTGVRVLLDEPDPDAAIPRGQGVLVTQIHVEPEDPVPHTTATAHVSLLNFEHTPTHHSFDLRVNGESQSTHTVLLPARAEHTTEIPFTVPDTPTVRVDVNPGAEVPTRPLTLNIETPGVARPGERFTISVSDQDGNVVAAAQIRIDDEPKATTNAQGQATLSVGTNSLVNLVAIHGDEAGFTTLRVAPPEWDDQAVLRAERVHVDRPFNHTSTHASIRAQATLVNLGGIDFDGYVEWHTEAHFHLEGLQLESGARTSQSIETRLPFGTHNLTIAGHTVTLTIADPAATDAPGDGDETSDDPDQAAPPPQDTRARTVEEYIARQASRSGGGTGQPGDPFDTFLSRVFQNLDNAIFLVILATIIHGGSLVWVTTLRDVRERGQIPGLLKSLGANEDQLRNLALRDALLATTPAILLGLILAPLALAGLAQFGYPAAFGHTLPAVWDLVFLARTGGAILLIALLAAIYGVYTNHKARQAIATRRRLAQWLQEEPENPPNTPSPSKATVTPTAGGPR